MPFCIAASYAVVSVLWIFISDRILTLSPAMAGNFRYWSTLKGWAFVLITAMLLYYILWSYARSIIKSREELERENKESALAHSALKESESNYRAIFDAANDAIFVYVTEPEVPPGKQESEMTDGRIVFVNRAGMILFGEEETGFVIGKSILDFVHEEFRVIARNRIKLLMAGNKVPPMEQKFVRRNGSLVNVEVTAVPFSYHGQQAAMVLARDMTERIATRDELKRALSLLTATLEATADGIIVRNLGGKIVIYNHKFVEMWQVPESILERKDEASLREFILGRLKAPEAFKDLTNDQVQEQTCDLLELSDGRVFERISKPQIIGNEIVGRVVSFRDITGRKMLEAQIRQAEKLEAIGTLAGGIAHDFNNMLTAINGYTTILQRKLGYDEQLSSYATKILLVTEKAAALTKGLLTYSRKQHSHPRPMDINLVIKRMDTLMSTILGENIEFRVSQSDGELMAIADDVQIEQILINLATNARDAITGKGWLEVSTRRAVIEEGKPGYPGQGKPGDYALVAVSDNGEGMEESTRDRIFEPFFTTKGLGKGTGLGLSMVYGAVKQNNGYIDVISEPGKGTTFNIYFPLA